MLWPCCAGFPASASRALAPRTWYAIRSSPGSSPPTSVMSRPSDERVVVQYACPRRGVPAAASLRRWAAMAVGEAAGQVVIRVVEADESRRLNAHYRHRDRPTNVLSFP